MPKFLFQKGHVVSAETRKKISEAHKGRKKYWKSSGDFKKGSIPWNKGKKTGKWKMSDEGKEKIRQAHLGEKNPQWRGGITPINKKIRRSSEFKAWRKAVFERDKYTCVQCGLHFIRGVTGQITIHPDHIQPFSTHPHLRFELSNGRTLCVDCHRKTDSWGKRYDLLSLKLDR